MTVHAPTFPLGRVFRDPEFVARRYLARTLARCVAYVGPSSSDLRIDVGCGSKPYAGLFDVRRYIGLDVEVSGHPAENKRADIYFDGVHLPFDDGGVDGVLCTEVLEHATDAPGLVGEIVRVLRPGAAAIISAPFVWPEHERPFDFRRFTSAGLETLCVGAGLDVELALTTMGAHGTIAQMNSLHLHAALGAGLPIWGSVVTAAVCAPVQIFGIAIESILPDRGAFYTQTVLVLRKPGAVE